MIPAIRQRFNANFTPEKYRHFLTHLDERCGTHIKFRNSETPCFFPRALIEQMAAYGKKLIEQLLTGPASADYRRRSDATIPPEFNAPGETPRPLFIQVDFGLIRNAAGGIEPRLVEIQGFASLYAYQAALAQQYEESYALRHMDASLRFLPAGMDLDAYYALLRRAILAGHDAENVVLMEIDPYDQKTLPDFLATQELFGIKIVNISDILKQGNQLFYQHHGKNIPIRRIYNRVIVDELMRKNKTLPFSFRDDLDVEWAGHPNWFFRLSKFSIPFLKHSCVPKTWFLHELDSLPDDPENCVLKPLYSFAGIGVIVGPTLEDLQRIPPEKRVEYILQERLSFAPVIETPCGPTQAEVRVMFIWLDTLQQGPTLVRTGRGKMMGVDYNRNLDWVGSSAGFYPE
jgi:hypothetical protein